MARAAVMAMAALLVLAATAVPAAAQLDLLLDQLPEDAPACITEVAELTPTQSDECTLALVYILGEAQALQQENENDGEGDEDPEEYDYTKIRQNLLCDCAVLYNADEVAQVQSCLETVFDFYAANITASTNATDEQVADAGSFIRDFNLTTLQDECNAPCQPKMKKQKNCVDSLCPTRNLTAVYFQEWGKCQKQCKCLPRPPVPCPEETTQEACEEQCKDSFGRTKADRYLFGEFEQLDGNVCPNVCQCNTCPGKFQGKGKNCKSYCNKQGAGANENGYKSIYIQGKKAFKSGPFECTKVCTCEECPAAISKEECTAICEGKEMRFKKLKKKNGCSAQKCLCKK